MTTTTAAAAETHAFPTFDLEADVAAIQEHGIVGLKGAFPRDWVERMREDVMASYEKAIVREGGAVSRGPKRWYVEVHPEEISGFVDLVSHPWISAVSAAVLGPEYQFVEIGFDVPFQGAKFQPWHRDFRAGRETYEDRRLSSLAFNLTAVDVTEDMGPFEIAPGTHWEAGQEWDHGMFPPKSDWERISPLGQRRFPRMGDVSARTALALHRGTAHASATARPVLILGVVARDVADPDVHSLEVTRGYYESLPQSVREHLLCRVVETLTPLVQRHDIEGLVMGAEAD